MYRDRESHWQLLPLLDKIVPIELENFVQFDKQRILSSEDIDLPYDC